MPIGIKTIASLPRQVVITTAHSELTIAMLAAAVPCRAKSPALLLSSMFTGGSSKQKKFSQVGG